MESVELEDLYSETVLEHCRHPRNRDVIEAPDISGRAVNPFCGDEVDLQIALDGDRVSGVGLQAVGCSINQASASMLSEAIAGRSLEEVDSTGELFRKMMAGPTLSGRSLERLGGLTALSDVQKVPVRIKCALLAWSALEEAIEDYRRGHPGKR